MRGKAATSKREITKDPIYGNLLLAKFINNLMKNGKKTIAQKVVYGALDIIKSKGEDPVQVFEKAIDEVGPRMEVKSRRIGGAAYQVPSEVRGVRKNALAIRWILESAAKRPTSEYKTFSEKLAIELLEASKNEGNAIKKRDSIHRMAEANKAFSHFRW
ncbi:MAG: 30S ribosomal protein S7 [Candidatus Levybacteria bacterium CG10_big_fil_rev_8_21_14_0_10_36_7]|nr:MAG: 30S ribosomal protein S7 [Candidatus Levybacteria bacterium CG10_big_fil_rev_8_21_14_0_10_36_7]